MGNFKNNQHYKTMYWYLFGTRCVHFWDYKWVKLSKLVIQQSFDFSTMTYGSVPWMLLFRDLLQFTRLSIDLPPYRTHYKEYLVDLINKNKLDPITMYTTMKIELMLTREEMDLPDKDDDDDDQVQRDKLIQVTSRVHFGNVYTSCLWYQPYYF